MCTSATNHRSHRTLPTTFEGALSQIRELENTLEAARHVWRVEGKGDLDEAVRRHRSAGQTSSEGQDLSLTAPNPSCASTARKSSSTDAPNTFQSSQPVNRSDADASASEDPSPPALEPVDIGPFVLRALALRKRAQIGSINEEKVEEEFEAFVEGAGLSEEQVRTLRQWAGL